MNCPPEHRSRLASLSASLAALLVLGGHLMLTLVYLSPPNIAQERLGALAKRYMQPFFQQSWHLFSPNPGISSRKLAIRCQADAAPWTEWFDPLEGLVAEHYRRRISGLGKLLYVYRAVGDDLRLAMNQRVLACHQRLARAPRPLAPDPATDPGIAAAKPEPRGSAASPCAPELLMDDLAQTHEFDLAMRYAQNVCEEYLDDRSAQDLRLQFKLLEFFPVQYANRSEADAALRQWDQVHEVIFPILESE